jgi:prevent-host-death family protein
MLANLAKCGGFMTIQANMHEAKSHLSQLADKATEGEVVIIAKAGKPYVQLIPVTQNDRVPGGYKELITVHGNFNDTDPEIQNMFEGD